MAGVDPMLPGLIVAVVFSVAVAVFPVLQRGWSLGLVSSLAAAAYYQRAFLGFVGVIALAYIALLWLRGQTSRSLRWRLACAALFLLIVVFTMGRLLHWDNSMVQLTSSVRLQIYVLDMWLLLRLVTLFWEVGSGAVSDLPLSRYIVWTCLPLTLAGPLLRYSQLPAEFRANRYFWMSPQWWFEMATAVGKMTIGFALGALQQITQTQWPKAHIGNSLLGVLITGPMGFYLTTAGYFQIMELLGRPAGFKIPESFNFPIGRKNISDFWMNWNMTATYVFRDYLFYNRWGRRNYNVYFNTLLLFTLVGLWHAANLYWVLWGFLHGLLFCTFVFWRKHANQFSNLPLRGTPIAQAGARVLTYVSVCACWYLPSKILQGVGVI